VKNQKRQNQLKMSDLLSWQRMLRNSSLPPNAKLVGFVISTRADGNGEAYPSLERLCKETSLSLRWVQQGLKLLRLAQFLTWERGGGRKANKYILLNPASGEALNMLHSSRHPDTMYQNSLIHSSNQRDHIKGTYKEVSPQPTKEEGEAPSTGVSPTSPPPVPKDYDPLEERKRWKVEAPPPSALQKIRRTLGKPEFLEE